MTASEVRVSRSIGMLGGSNKTDIVLAKPAIPGRTYEVIYESTDPAIAGLGLAAVRDLISFLRYGGSDLYRSIRHAIGFGTSQSAMLLKALVYEGFNADESGRQVFDGIFSHVAGGRRSTVHRFTQHSRTAGPLRNASFSTTDQFPFSDVTTTDRETGITDGVLQASKSHTYRRSFTRTLPTSTGAQLERLCTRPSTAKMTWRFPPRRECTCWREAKHGPASFPPAAGRGQNMANFNDYRWIHRALLARLQEWVAEGKEPPPSAHPSLSSKTLVPIRDYAFPSIPHVAVPGMPHVSERLDLGPSYRKRGVIRSRTTALGKTVRRPGTASRS